LIVFDDAAILPDKESLYVTDIGVTIPSVFIQPVSIRVTRRSRESGGMRSRLYQSNRLNRTREYLQHSRLYRLFNVVNVSYERNLVKLAKPVTRSHGGAV